MISNAQTYTTHNKVHNSSVEKNPKGVDTFTDKKKHNINKNELKYYKNEKIKTDVILIERKSPAGKGAM